MSWDIPHNITAMQLNECPSEFLDELAVSLMPEVQCFAPLRVVSCDTTAGVLRLLFLIVEVTHHATSRANLKFERITQRVFFP
jgi:hypothetical protein